MGVGGTGFFTPKTVGSHQKRLKLKEINTPLIGELPGDGQLNICDGMEWNGLASGYFTQGKSPFLISNGKQVIHPYTEVSQVVWDPQTMGFNTKMVQVWMISGTPHLKKPATTVHCPHIKELPLRRSDAKGQGDCCTRREPQGVQPGSNDQYRVI